MQLCIRFSALRLSSLAALLACMSLVQGCATTGDASMKENAVVHQTTQADIDALASKDALVGKQATLYVNGLGCPQCASNADAQLKRFKGIASTHTDLGLGVVHVELMGKGNPTPLMLREAIADAGFTLKKITTP